LKGDVMSFNYSGCLDKTNADMVADQLMYHDVIGKRKAQLDMLKEGFRGHRVLEFVQKRSFLKDGLFPRWATLNSTAEYIISKLVKNCSDFHFSIVKNFIQGLQGIFSY